MKLTQVVFVVALVVSCAAPPAVRQYVVRQPDARGKTVVVLPATIARVDQLAADVVTNLVIGSGSLVRERPSMVDTTEEYHATAGAARLSQVGQVFGITTDKTATVAGRSRAGDPIDALDKADAEYALIVRHGGEDFWLKVVNVKSRQVLHSGVFSTRDTLAPASGCAGFTPAARAGETAQDRMAELLKKVGLIVE